jgi:hypothetical protein
MSTEHALRKQRELIVQRRAYRHRQHADQVALERRKLPRHSPDAHVQAHLRNAFAASERARKLADDQDQREIDTIDRELARLTKNEPQTAA